MPVSGLVRVGGLAAVGSGILVVFGELLYFVIGLDEAWVASAETAASALAIFQGVVFLTSIVLLLGGLISLYVVQSDSASTLGKAGFVVAFVGTALVVGSTWSFTFDLPALAQQAPEVYDTPPPLLSRFGVAASFAAFSIGWVLFGISILRNRTYPRVAAILLIVGAVLAFLPFPFTVIVFGVAVAWMGMSLLSRQTMVAEQSSRVR